VTPSLPDLDRRAEIHDLVVGFYREIAFDDVLAPVFTEVAETDWTTHMPKLIDYWCRVLLGARGYDGWFLGGHQRIHAMDPLTLEHCDRWYRLWVDMVDARWAGPKANEAKTHAQRMMAVLARKVIGARWMPPGGDG
jgi:hemoglobin